MRRSVRSLLFRVYSGLDPSSERSLGLIVGLLRRSAVIDLARQRLDVEKHIVILGLR
jgi:hypothetical protein